MISNNEYYKFIVPEKLLFFIKVQDSTMDFFYRMCVDEYEKLKDYIAPANNILDIGCGTGRSSIFFKNMLKLKSKFYLADFNENKQYPNGQTPQVPLGYHHNAEPKPFNSLDFTREFCGINNLTNLRILNLTNNEIISLKDIDLLYSFYSVGYHFSIDDTFEKYNLNDITNKNAKFIFGVRKELMNEIDTSQSKYLNIIKKISGSVHQDFCIYEKKN